MLNMAKNNIAPIRPGEMRAGEAPIVVTSKASKRKPLMTVRGLRKTFDGAVVYDDFGIDLPLGHFISIFGPNGCGKSTFINMVSGLMPMDAGEVLYDGQLVSETRVSYVFQNYREALFPWLKAIDNIHYPLKVMGVPARSAISASRSFWPNSRCASTSTPIPTPYRVGSNRRFPFSPRSSPSPRCCFSTSHSRRLTTK